MPKATSFKQVVVKEDPKTSLREAGIYDLTLANGMKAVALGHLYFPDHDRSIFAAVLDYLRATKPDVVFLLGGIINEEAFKTLVDEEDTYLHDANDAPEVTEAREAGLFEDKILALGKTCGEFVRSIQAASGGKVFYIPSATHLSMGNEVRLLEFLNRKKKVLDQWTSNHPEASDLPSDPTVELPKTLAGLLELEDEPNIEILRFGSAVRVNGKTLFMIGDFRRRNAGDASKVEWEQRMCDIVRSFDGKVASSWMTTPDNTLPGLKLKFHQFHEVGYLWDPSRMGHYRDYDRRAPGFWVGTIVEGELFGQSVVIMRGNDGRRSFVVDGVAYREEEAGALPNGRELSLSPRTTESKDVVNPKPAPRRRTTRRSTKGGKSA